MLSYGQFPLLQKELVDKRHMDKTVIRNQMKAKSLPCKMEQSADGGKRKQ